MVVEVVAEGLVAEGEGSVVVEEVGFHSRVY